jgi:hypothetical protein
MKDYASMLLGPELTTPVEGTGLKDYASQIMGDAATPAAKKPFQPPAPTALERFGRGFADYTQGVEQIARMVTGNDPKGFNAEKTAELDLYERGRGPAAGVDWMRIAGNAAVTAPLMALPGATSSSMLARGASGAVGGAVGSGLQFVPDGGSRTLNTMLGAGLGGVVGAVAPPLIDKLGKAIRFGWEKIAGRNISDAATSAVTQAAQQAGVAVPELQSSGIFASLAAEVDDAMRQGTQFTPNQLQRLVEMRAVGANPMKANITRTPEDWTTMENMRGMAKIAAPINNRVVENSRALVEYTEGLRSGTGGRAASPYEAGRSVLEAVETKSKEMQDAVGALYEGIRKSVGDKVGLQPQRMLSVLDDISDDAAADPLVSSVNRRMTRLGLIDKDGQPTGKALDVRTAEELRKWIGNLSDKNEPAIKRLKAMVVDALDDDVIETAGDDAFKAARNAARQRFAEFEQGVLGKAAKGDLAPDDFVKRHILGAKVDDLKAMKKTLTVGTPEQVARGTQAWNDARGWAITDIMMKATGATSPEDVVGKQFSGQRFKKALDGLGLEKMAILFTPDEMNRLRTLQKASEYLTTQVPGSAPNYSRTGAAITERLAQLFPKIPLLASVFGGPTGAAAGMAATGAAKAVGASQSAKALSQQLGGLPTAAARQIRPNRFLGSVPAAAAGVATQPGDGQ